MTSLEHPAKSVIKASFNHIVVIVLLNSVTFPIIYYTAPYVTVLL